MKKLALLLLLAGRLGALRAEDGYRLWLRYDRLTDTALLRSYRSLLDGLEFRAGSPTLLAARRELCMGLVGMLAMPHDTLAPAPGSLPAHCMLVGTPRSLPALAAFHLDDNLAALGEEGYLIRAITIAGSQHILIAAATDKGILYGVFHFLRLLQTHASLTRIGIGSS
ncbi:MAG TPA: alpha-glucuronidase family glycosyl hydrolase, partial [Puia sp.]|nr:alpha-glucuronidase family glycosyl hydrolase [Puia sp.]